MSRCYFWGISTELKQAIFSGMTDVSSVFATILTCSVLRRAFLAAESLILSSILQRILDPTVAFDAIAALEASRLGPTDETWSKKAVQDVMAAYDGVRSASWSRLWRLRDALFLENLDEQTKYFTTEFITSALSIHPITAVKGLQHTPSRPPSSSEVGRVQRTCYRFELYCSLFRGRDRVRRRGSRGQLLPAKPVERFDLDEQFATFFSRFPVWENEQLASFDDIAKHDVAWGQRGVAYLGYFEPTRDVVKENYLLLGLSYLHRVVSASTYDARRDLLDREFRHDTVSFSDALSHQPRHDSVTFALESPEARASVLDHPHAADADTGPKDAWLWAHEEAYPSALCNDVYRGNVFLRQRGYVMWDRSRCDQWKLLDMDFDVWEELRYGQQQSSPNNLSRHHAQMQYSFKRRSSVYRCGGRGWWAPGDESKVFWPEGRPPKGWLSEEEWWKKKLAEAEEDERLTIKEAERKARGLTDLEELLLANQ